MRFMKIALAFAGVLAIACASPAWATDDSLTAKNATPATVTFCSKDIGGGVMSPCSMPIDTSGNKINVAKDSSVTETHASPGSDGTKAISIQGVTSGKAVPVSGTFWQTTQPVSAASLPLPTGAATAAKQPALGTAGSASSDVITVQGIASGTALSISAAALPLPTGAATAALQPTAAAQDSTTSGQTGHLVQCAVLTAAPTYTTAHTDPLSCDTSGNLRVAAASAASENHLGEVGVHSFIVGATFTTTSTTTLLNDGQLLANNATAGSVTPLDFTTVCRVNQGQFHVWRARIKIPDTGLAGKSLWLKLYRDSPTVTNGDHGTWLSTESNYIGQISVTLDQHFSDPIEKGIGAPSVGNAINGDCASSSQHIYGLIVSNGGSATLQGTKVLSAVLEGSDE